MSEELSSQQVILMVGIVGILLGALVVFVWSSDQMARCYPTGEINENKYVLTVNTQQCAELCDLIGQNAYYLEDGVNCGRWLDSQELEK